MARIARSLSVEKVLDSQESKRDAEVLKDISSGLPSASRVKIFKKDEGNKLFIVSIPAEDFMSTDVHEYIKSKYSKKHGSGEYLVELLDSNGDVVNKSIIAIAGESEKKAEDVKHARIVEEALDMRDKAFEKVKEAEQEKREAEKTKYETMIDGMNRQWETIQKMYDSQILVLKDQLEDTKDKDTQYTIQREIDKINRDFENARNKFEYDLRSREESRGASDKVFDLVNSLIPLIIQKSTREEKDPIEELSKTITLVNTMTGGKKDIIESLLENPNKTQLFQKLLGIDSDGKKDFFSDAMENPFKMEMFKKMFGMEEKKDFLVEMIDNPQRLDIFKKLFGTDTQEVLIGEIKRLGENLASKDIAPVEPKTFLDELIEAKSKYEQLKGLFSPSQPARTFVELISTVISNAGPHIAQAVNSYMNGMVTLEMVRKGIVKPGMITPEMQYAMLNAQGYQGANATDLEPVAEKNKPVAESKPMSVEEAFKTIIVKILEKEQGRIESEIFIDKVAESVVLNMKRNPSLILQVLKLGGFEEITAKMSSILMELLGMEESISFEMSKQIADKVVKSME